jgi:spore germination cell wall hydrolase CwlJ-like protein
MLAPAPALTIEQQPEPIVMRMLAYGEARGEGARGINAVLHVVQNRALKADTTFKHEALRPLQFSCFNANDPNRPALLSAWVHDPTTWAICDAICTLFEAGETKDATGGARNYFVALMSNPPAWTMFQNGWVRTASIGKHEFGNAA